MSNIHQPIVVIGGGAAGIIAAWRAASRGAQVVLVEKNPKLGIKILISGGGKCNFTHAGNMEDIRATFVPEEARFLKPAFYQFTNSDALRLLEQKGIPMAARPDGRVFPVRGNAREVVETLSGYLREAGVETRTGVPVKGISSNEQKIAGVVLANGTIETSIVILATGGCSYRKTGATGDGLAWAGRLGHTVVPPRAALAPIRVTPTLPQEWRGIAIRGGCLSVYTNNKKLIEWQGDLLFTHEGISGPAPLEVSRAAARALEDGPVALQFDFFPSASFPELDAVLQKAILSQRTRMIANVLERLLPKRIIPYLLASLQVDASMRGHQITRGQRRAITLLLKSWHVGEVSDVPLDRGEVTAGGIALSEIDPKTMASRLVNGLYICGEVLDIAGRVGGYNLQAAFSTGYVAGSSAAERWLSTVMEIA